MARGENTPESATKGPRWFWFGTLLGLTVSPNHIIGILTERAEKGETNRDLEPKLINDFQIRGVAIVCAVLATVLWGFIAFQDIRGPLESQIVAPLNRPSNPFSAILAGVHSNLIRIESWIKQAIRPGQDRPTADVRRKGNVVTLTKDVSIHIKNGIIGLPAGKKLAFLSRRGATVQVRDINGEDYDIPISATDLQ